MSLDEIIKANTIGIGRMAKDGSFKDLVELKKYNTVVAGTAKAICYGVLPPSEDEKTDFDSLFRAAIGKAARGNK